MSSGHWEYNDFVTQRQHGDRRNEAAASIIMKIGRVITYVGKFESGDLDGGTTDDVRMDESY
jgi:hypothetical protein